MAFIGPGAHDVTREFGTDVHHKMHFGAPYSWRPENLNPGAGSYNATVTPVRPKMSVAKFNKSEKGDRLGKDSFLESPVKDNPSSAEYQKVNESFCGKTRKLSMFGKYKEKFNENPGPNSYNIAKSQEYLKPRVQTLSWRKPKLFKINV